MKKIKEFLYRKSIRFSNEYTESLSELVTIEQSFVNSGKIKILIELCETEGLIIFLSEGKLSIYEELK